MAQVSAEKLEHTGPVEKKSGLSATKCEITKESRVAFAKRKRDRNIGWSRLPDCDVGESRGEREPHLSENQEDHSKGRRRKEWTPH